MVARIAAGDIPRDLDQLDLLVGNRSALQCPRASGPYHYEPPKGPADGDSIILSCVNAGHTRPETGALR